MLTYLASLNFLWDFLKPLITDPMKERLKPKVPAVVAKERAISLYNALGEVRDAIDEFVKVLQSSVHTAKKTSREFHGKESELAILLASRLDPALEHLEISLKQINPQLEIHHYELNERLILLQDSDHEITEDTRKLLPYLEFYDCGDGTTPEDLKKFSAVVKDATKNQKLLKDAIENYRDFIAKEFSFKESF